ncbi:MAG: methylated-DNA--[protein]-cysteine S-methyltransferase [Geobacter sp.]|nr:methylated-DNA--[protein]-cysteine S-methyltransferase [Geobacter sp.]
MRRRCVQNGRYAVYHTVLGWGAVLASDNRLVEVMLPFERSGKEELTSRIVSEWPDAREGNGLEKEAAVLLAAYFAGQRIPFQLPLDQSGFTPFQKLVYAVVATIPYGSVRTYGDVAQAIGSAGAARGVGTAMAANPLPIIIPCHRVVGASGKLTGYSGPGGIETKAWLLRQEGVLLDRRERVAEIIRQSDP